MEYVSHAALCEELRSAGAVPVERLPPSKDFPDGKRIPDSSHRPWRTAGGYYFWVPRPLIDGTIEAVAHDHLVRVANTHRVAP